MKRNLIKILLTLAVLFACLGFAACGEDINLTAPSNLRLEGGALCWDSVEGAEGYSVYINGEENTTSDCRFPLNELDETKVYSFEVQAYGGGHRSRYSDISYAGKYTLPTEGLEFVFIKTLGSSLQDMPHYQVSKFAADEDGLCVIPAEYEGLPVKEFSIKETPEAARIKELYLPNTMYKYHLGGSLFACFPNLERITIAEGNETAFSEGNCLIEKETNKLLVGCIDSVIPACVTSIGPDAFRNRQIKEMYIPDNVTVMSGYVFAHCDKLEKIRLPQRLTGRLNYVFVRCASLNNVVISDGIESLLYTFWGCSSLTDVTLPDSVTEMRGTFRECTALKEVKIPKLVKVLDETFRGCTGLESFTVPGTVENLRGAFWDCTALKSVVVEEGVKYLRALGTLERGYQGAFYNCVSLTDVLLPLSLEEVGPSAFYNCKSLESIVIPDGVKSIFGFAFFNCASLKRIKLSKNLRTVAGFAIFRNCTSLEFIDIPADVATPIDDDFWGCIALRAVVLPKVIKTMAAVFEDCPLEEVYCRGTEEDWEENQGTIYQKDTVLFAATRYYYSETEPETEGNFWHYVDDLPVKW